MMITRNPCKGCWLLASIMATACCQPLALAAAQLEEVIVSAQKRDENQQTVPVSISAFSADELDRIGFDDIDDLVAHVPSLTIGTNVSPLSTSFRLRNVGKFSAIPSFEPAVGLFIDGAFRARSGLGLGDLVDVSRVEVLKGPQSVLYGKNVSAGVVSVETQGPTETFEGMLEYTLGTDNLRQFKGYVSGPLAGGLNARLSAISTRRDPFMENLIGEAHDDIGSEAIRAQLAFEPSEGFLSRLIVGYVDKDMHPKQGDTFASPALVEIIRNAGGQVSNNDPRDGTVEYDDFNRFKLTAVDVIWRNVYQAETWSLTSISSYDEYDALSQLHDVEQMSLSIATFDDPQFGRTLSQELRLDTELSERSSFLGGLYYLKNTFRHGDRGRAEFVLEEDIEELGDSIVKFIFGVPPIPGPLVPVLGVEGDRGDFYAQLDTEAFGVFGKLDIALTQQWSVAAGLRYSSERKTGSLEQSTQLSPLGCVPPLNTNFLCSVTPDGNNFDQTDSFSATTGSVQTRYFLSDKTMVYASVATGFKSGGYSLQYGLAPSELRPYDSEDIRSVEIGWKSDFWNGLARVNGALFHTDYDNFQEASFEGLFFIVNAAEAVSVEGVELDGTLVLSENLIANLSVQYVDSIYEKYSGGRCAYSRPPDNALGQCDLSGEKLPGANEFKGRASLAWQAPLYGGSAYAWLYYVFVSEYNSSSEIDPRFDQDSLGFIGLRLGWRSSRFDLSLLGKNLTNLNFVDQSANANVLTPIDRAVGSPEGSFQNYIGEPRELALTLRLLF